LELSSLPATTRAQDLEALSDANEDAAARQSLEATLRHWQDGREILARDWIEELYQEVWPIAKKQGFSCFLSPVKKILREGNTAQQWLRSYSGSSDSRSVIVQAIQAMVEQERELEDKLCQLLVA
jgi:predicted glutamate--cysteine ligase